MRRLLLFPLLGLLSCGPTVSRPASTGLKAAFSELGVVWVVAGQACVARMPDYTPLCPRTPWVVDVAWNGQDAWAAVPSAGVVLTLDRTPRSLSAGAVALLSGQRIYREDGSALSYSGAKGKGVAGTPTAVVTDAAGIDYVSLAGKIRRVEDGLSLGEAKGPYLVATLNSAVMALIPTVYTTFGAYRLNGTALERVDNTGHLLASVPHGPGRVGLVGNDVVTVSEASQAGRVVVRRFSADLKPLR